MMDKHTKEGKMPEKMCPLMSIATGFDMYAKCMQHKCAWFDDILGECICITIARNINPFAHLVVQEEVEK